jgi:subtilase family serine protease
MRAFYRSISALSVAALTFTACSGGSSPSTPVRPQTIATAPAQTNPTSPVGNTAFFYDQPFVQKGQLIGPAKFSHLGIDVVLRMRDPQGLLTFAQAVSDPKSNSYRQFLTPEQIGDRFGASVSDQNAAIAYFHKYGIWVSGWKQRMMLHAAGSQAQLEAAFHTKFGEYRSPQGEMFFAPENAPTVGANVPLVGSANIVARTKRYTRQFVTSKGDGTGYSPQQTAAAFDFDGAYAAGYTGGGVTIGIIGTGPIVTSFLGKKVGDADAYRQLYNVGGVGTVNIIATTGSDTVANGASGFAPPLPVVISGCNATQTNPDDGLASSDSPTATCNPEDTEAQLDTEQASSLAKNSGVEFYLAYNPNDGCVDGSGNPIQASPCPAGAGIPEQGLFETDEELQTIIDHNTADVISGSYGGPELGDLEAGPVSPPAPFTSAGTGLDPTEFAMMVSEGMAVFMSSGDEGANTCQLGVQGHVDDACVSYPASDPSVVGVGGTTTPLNAAGQIAGPISAWGVQTFAGGAGTGGGVSGVFAQPAYQLGAPGMIGSTKRNVPDLALNGDPATGVAVLLYADSSFGGAELGSVGGTSVAAPEMAAMWALVISACKQHSSCTSKGSGAHPWRLGNPDPLVYGIYSSAATYGSTFLSVLYGDNSLSAYCLNPQNAAGDPIDCPTPGPGQTATPIPSIPPLDPGYSANPNGGYNQLTGLGVPFARALIRSVVGV